MQVRVLYFGIISDMAKRKEEVVEIEAGTSIGDLYDRLKAANTNFAEVARQTRPVLNGKNASVDELLQDGDEVAIMRAIGGGDVFERCCS